ncbi:hypothetical protein BFF78_06140 [Streptomyces fodineus]|uniref:DUF4333 domain-containing protein n=1 Tax=Streptomyces fodineus TaxID=1904616 RepID=A0A1D7Y518_9ACTN|nr:DUF4333 domain-containing protein [Streptomyces fodineus]AOR30683.1 hypothetical protein BFF78_06140 [Streptomyces fodineus]
MWSRFVIGIIGSAVAVTVLGAVGTHVIADPESTSRLDVDSTVNVGGQKALAADVVESRTEHRYHPLPWVGTKLSGVTCPTGLKAVAGASITCTGRKPDGSAVRIPVRVRRATDSTVTWIFDR